MKQTEEEILISHNKSNKKWRDKNPDKVKLWNKKYYKNNIEESKAASKKWAKENPEKAKASSSKYYKNNTEKMKNKKCKDCGNRCFGIRCMNCYSKKRKKESFTKEEKKSKKRAWARENNYKLYKNHKRWRDKNPEKVKASVKKWQKENPEKFKECSNKWNRENPEKFKECIKKSKKKNNEKVKEYEQTAKRKVSIKLRMRVVNALRLYTKDGKVKSSDEYGINYKKIIEHLKPFPEDQSKYHIDHIKPLCSFNLENPDEIEEAFAPENHQWLLAEDNLSKGSKWKENSEKNIS